MQVYFLPGLAEGPVHAVAFTAALQRAGHQVVQTLHEADTIIAHSGACFTVPTDLPDKIVVLANPTCTRRRRLPLLMFAKIGQDLRGCLQQHQFGRWAYKTFWNTIYMVRPRHIWHMAQGVRRHNYVIPTIFARQVAVITNQHDPWRSSVRASAIAAHPAYSFITMPGGHDDLWLHPTNWVNIVQYLYDA